MVTNGARNLEPPPVCNRDSVRHKQSVTAGAEAEIRQLTVGPLQSVPSASTVNVLTSHHKNQSNLVLCKVILKVKLEGTR